MRSDSVRVFLYGVLLSAALLGSARSAHGQMLPVGDPLEDYARLLQLNGQIPAFSFTNRPLPVRQYFGRLDPAQPHPWSEVLGRYPSGPGRKLIGYGLFDPSLDVFWNSARPNGQNDGAVWQGRGVTAALTAGGFVRLGILSAALRPSLIYTQNRAFDPWPGARYAYPLLLGVIDLPQRFGPDPYTTLDLGESYVRLDLRGLALGLSNETMWWGPAVRNAIIMSNNAPGFPHAFLGTSGPLNVWLGHLQARWVWGVLHESDYFDDNPDNDRRYLTGIGADFAPRWIPGLYLGGTRVFTRYMPDRLERRDLLLIFQNLFKEDLADEHDEWGFDNLDQMLSVFARWIFPKSGFEVYGELARGDHNANLRDFILHPQHGSGYTLGLQKSFGLAARRRLRFSAELTKLEATKSNLLRNASWASFFYVHEVVRQGYTSRGQVIGAGIGPGSNSQEAALDLFAPWGRAGFLVRRVVHDNDRYYQQQPDANSAHEVELSLGVRGLVFYRGFELEGAVAAGRMMNQFYEYKNDRSNLHVRLTVRRPFTGYR